MLFELVKKVLGKIGGSQSGVHNASLLGLCAMMNDS
jgi:hypothetical protein